MSFSIYFSVNLTEKV